MWGGATCWRDYSWGFWLSMGGSPGDPIVCVGVQEITDLQLGSPVCPLLVIFGNDNTAAWGLRPKRARREPAGGDHRALPVAPPSLLGLRRLLEQGGLRCSLQRHREELVPRLAADLLGAHTQQHLGVFKLVHHFLQPGAGRGQSLEGDSGTRRGLRCIQPTEAPPPHPWG